MRAAHNRPAYKYLHVGIPHWPAALNAECEYVGVRSLGRSTYTEQARCAVSRLGALFDKLRGMGLYDSSLIVISSDHGVALPPREFKGDRDVFGAPLSELAGSSLALLLVKPPHAAGPVRISRAPTSISDIPATIGDTLGLKNSFSGTSALELDEHASRPRQFATYLWNTAQWKADFFPYLDLFTIDGNPADGNSWNLEEPIYAPGPTAPDVRTRGFYRPERGGPGKLFRWSTPLALIHQPPGARGIELKVRSAAETPQTLTVEAGGRTIDERVLSDHDWHTLTYTIPPSTASPTAGEWITLRVAPPWRARGDRRVFGVMTADLKWLD
jgi:hypothetical protein